MAVFWLVLTVGGYAVRDVAAAEERSKHARRPAISELGRIPPVRTGHGASYLQQSTRDIPVLSHVARSDWLNVKNPTFGAVGDGVHDDGPAIQLALHALSSGIGHNGSTTVYFPPGTYLVKKTLLLGDLPLHGSSKRSGMMGGNLIGYLQVLVSTSSLRASMVSLRIEKRSL